MNIAQEIKKGAFWVLLFSVIGGPIALLRNWLFTQYDPTGTYVADFALVMVLFNVITTFFVFGGNSVLTNFVPKIDSKEHRSSFLFSYFGVSFVLFVLLVLLTLIYPHSIVFLTNNRISMEQNIYIVFLAIPVILSQILIYFLQGSLDYKTSSFLSQVPNFLNTGVVLLLLLFHVPMKNIVVQDSLIIFLSSVLFLGSVIIVLWGGGNLRKYVSLKKIRLYVPKGFWKFSIHVHLLTLITFFYQNFDQLFVLKMIGLKELGYYFVIIQLVETVRFIPLKIGQVLLASFSKIAHTGVEEDLIKTYGKISRIVIIINLTLTTFLVVFAYFALDFFNISGNSYKTSFIILLIGYNIAAVGNLNTMVLLANEQSKQFFINSLFVLIGLIVGLLLFSSSGFIGVIIAKVASIIIGQIGLFYLMYKEVNARIGIDKNYIFSQVFLVILGIIFICFDLYNPLIAFVILIGCYISIYKYYGVSISEMKSLFNVRKY